MKIMEPYFIVKLHRKKFDQAELDNLNHIH